MALIKCKECGNEVSTTAPTCQKCGAQVARKPIGCGSAIVIVVVLLVLGKYMDSMLRSEISPAAPVTTGVDRQTDNSVRQGWLLDFDRRGEVALWQKPAPPFHDGNKVAAVVAFPNMPLGESMITDVTEQRLVGGIVYYHIRFDEKREGWVDVDYLHWKKVRR